jgi:hypothetical protein
MSNFYNRFLSLFITLLLISCGGDNNQSSPALISEPIFSPEPVIQLLPLVSQVNLSTTAPKQYQKLELVIELDAEYNNPYNREEIAINAIFTSPSGEAFLVSGFWDARADWLIRFSPSSAGQWLYTISVQDIQGLSPLYSGEFTVNEATTSGWIQTGKQFNSNYSNKYLVHHDGTPFYGVGHADAFIANRDFSSQQANGVDNLILNMKEADENYIVWWPQFHFSIVEDNYNSYNLNNLTVIDTVLEKLEQEELFVIFTLWDHSQLRDNNHHWLDGNWFNNNGFNNLSSLNDFFITDEAWLWQTNLYHYIISRYGYSSSIAMWQTVSEIDGTNAFDQTNTWHEKVNSYFLENDPYHHLTTASMSGDVIWDEGHQVMDIVQVHIYQDLLNTELIPNITSTADVIANYTQSMWSNNDKPNWIGEFGVLNNTNFINENYYPEVFHHALWAALSNGAALTPAEWNDFFDWEVMTTEMKEHSSYLSLFMKDIPMALWDPLPIQITDNSTTKSWGILGNIGGIIWTQDKLLENLSINDIRTTKTIRTDVAIYLPMINEGTYKVTPFNTWQGEFIESFEIDCNVIDESGCKINLPNFISDIALKLDKIE